MQTVQQGMNWPICYSLGKHFCQNIISSQGMTCWLRFHNLTDYEGMLADIVDPVRLNCMYILLVCKNQLWRLDQNLISQYLGSVSILYWVIYMVREGCGQVIKSIGSDGVLVCMKVEFSHQFLEREEFSLIKIVLP